MVSIAELERSALELPENLRAVLAHHLLQSLPELFDDADEGLSEAIRRDRELSTHPTIGLSLEQFSDKVQHR